MFTEFANLEEQTVGAILFTFAAGLFVYIYKDEK